MLWIGDKKAGRLYVGDKAVATLYRGGQLIWQAVRSCFGSGWWNDAKPWDDRDPWKD